MTEPKPASLPPPATYIQAWAESLAQALGRIAGSAFPTVILPEAPPELPPAGEADLWIAGTSAGGLRGEISLRLSPASVLRLAQIFMSEPVTPGVEVTAEHREAAVELLRQVGGLVASALKPRWGEIPLRLDPAAGAPSWPASFTSWLRAGDDPQSATLLEIQLSVALVAALHAEKTEPAGSAATSSGMSAAISSSTASVSPSPEPSPVKPTPDKLDLLMDVELAITLRFGSRRLLLREVLDLIPGAVVDLDRQVEDPVDVLLDGRLVARGEVVVLDGNYGVRVTEVAPASPLER